MSSSADIADFLTVHTVSVQTYEGTTGNGAKTYAASASIDGFLTRKQQLVRDINGDQVLAQSTFSCDASNAAALTPGSKVTLPGETKPTFVINRLVTDGGSVVPGLDRVRVFLQ